jgi:hypothetical protein
MKQLLEQALVSKDIKKARNGHLRKDKKKGGAPTGQKESGRLAKEKNVKQETDSEAESKLESLSDSHFEAGIVKGGE